MISGITETVGDESRTFRMTTRAMMAIEDRFDKGLTAVMQGLEDGFKVSDLVHLIAECANDGAGVSVEEAAALLDQIGVTAAGDLLGRVTEAAFPDAEGKSKNAKRATRSK